MFNTKFTSSDSGFNPTFKQDGQSAKINFNGYEVLKGKDGGYYVPNVIDNNNGTATISFTPSITDMPEVGSVNFITGTKTKLIYFYIISIDKNYYVHCDEPFEKIYQAYQNGMVLIAIDGSSNQYCLASITQTEVRFARVYYKDGNIMADTFIKTVTGSSFTRSGVGTDNIAAVKVVDISSVYDTTGFNYSCGATTFSDITTAYSNGQVVVARVLFMGIVQPAFYYLSALNATSATFSQETNSDMGISVITYKIDNTNKVTLSSTTIPKSSGGLGEPDFMGDPIIINNGYYTVIACTEDESVVHNFGVFYYEPYEAMPIYAGLTRLFINWDTGKLTIEECTQTVEGNRIVNTYTDATENYNIYVAKLS